MARNNSSLNAAKAARNDEFYTRYEDVERQMMFYVNYDKDVFKDKTVLLPCDDPDWSNFTKFFLNRGRQFGLKRLISTSYDKNGGQGKLYTREWVQGKLVKNLVTSLRGDGDFRSDEVTALRDQSDFVITNPPFSLFDEFTTWATAGRSQMSVIGPTNAVTSPYVFPLLLKGGLWKGLGFEAGNAFFLCPSGGGNYAGGVYDPATGMVKFRNVTWYTNVDHGDRHKPLKGLMTMSDNKAYSKDYQRHASRAYKRYDNYDAIEVPTVKLIPSDYTGVMGVPITFLDKFNPDQFEILGITDREATPEVEKLRIAGAVKYDRPYLDSDRIFARILIRPKSPAAGRTPATDGTTEGTAA